MHFQANLLASIEKNQNKVWEKKLQTTQWTWANTKLYIQPLNQLNTNYQTQKYYNVKKAETNYNSYDIQPRSRAGYSQKKIKEK